MYYHANKISSLRVQCVRSAQAHLRVGYLDTHITLPVYLRFTARNWRRLWLERSKICQVTLPLYGTTCQYENDGDWLEVEQWKQKLAVNFSQKHGLVIAFVWSLRGKTATHKKCSRKFPLPVIFRLLLRQKVTFPSDWKYSKIAKVIKGHNSPEIVYHTFEFRPGQLAVRAPRFLGGAEIRINICYVHPLMFWQRSGSCNPLF